MQELYDTPNWESKVRSVLSIINPLECFKRSIYYYTKKYTHYAFQSI